jgi:hypothetical protein
VPFAQNGVGLISGLDPRSGFFIAVIALLVIVVLSLGNKGGAHGTH